MKIQKIDLMLLNKARLAEVENPEKETTAMSETETNPEESIKTLSFMGLRNLMSNPNLAKKAGAIGVAALAGLGVTSCKDYDDHPWQEGDTIVNTSVSVSVDLKALQAMWQQMLEEMRASREEDKKYYQEMVKMFQDFIDMYQQKTLDDKAFQDKVLLNQNSIIALLTAQGIDIADANAILSDILNSTKPLAEKMDLLNSLVQNIDKNVSNLVQKADKAESSRQIMIALLRGTYKNTSIIKSQGEQMLENDSVKIAALEQLGYKLDKLDLDMTAGFETFLEQSKMDKEQLFALMIRIGYTQTKVMQMTAGDIIKAIKENTAVTKAEDEKILDALKNIDIDSDGAIAQILAVLEKISGKLDIVISQLSSLNSKVDRYGKEARQFYIQNHKDAEELIKAVYKNTDATKAQTARLDSLISLENQKFAFADSLLSAKTEDIENAIKQHGKDIEEAFKINNMHEEMRAEELKKLLEAWKRQDYINDTKSLENQKTIISLIEKYGPLLESGSNKAIIDKIQEFMDQEKAADEAAAKQQDVNTQAIIDAINGVKAELEALGKKVDDILDKMGDIIKNQKQYGDAVLSKLGNMETTLNALANEIPDLKLLVSYVKDLRTNSYTANTYLKTIADKQLEIKDAIDSLNVIAGGSGLTKEELQELWAQHDSIAAATFKDFSDELFGYLKKGNDIAYDTYTIVANWAAKADKDAADYKKILNDIFEYLPNLICKCKCGEDVNNNEGIRDQINNHINP